MSFDAQEQADHEAHMRRALRLAWRGRGLVEPNPMVGCVLVRDGGVIGEGFHRRFGGAHGEVEALTDCRRRGRDPAGADVYVTLEPCSHHGKTPPCVEALIGAKVARVFVAMLDPFDRADGRGVAALRGAGVDVHVGLCEPIAREQNKAFIKRITTGLPWVMAKWAQTIDGRIAAASGDSKWISNALSRRLAHKQRARADAIIVGIRTVLADDPLLTARDVPVRRRARRVVVDPQLCLLPDAQIVRSLSDADAPPVTVAVSEETAQAEAERIAALAEHGVEVVGLPPVDPDSDRLDLAALLRFLVDKYTATNVLVEGGGRLIGSLLAQRLIDQAVVFLAPKLLGDADAVPAAAGLSRDGIADADRLRLRRTKRLGDDLVIDYRFDHAAPGGAP